MAQSLAKVNLHLVFSTKNRRPCLTETIQPRVHAYLAGTLRNLGSEVYAVGGYTDHVHLLFTLPRTLSISQLVEKVKTGSSKWLKDENGISDFYWQGGFGVFSISESDIPGVRHYIEGQHEHHHKRTFQEELRELFAEHGIEFDERYVWD
jgi:REP-associated tyrosine transposase